MWTSNKQEEIAWFSLSVKLVVDGEYIGAPQLEQDSAKQNIHCFLCIIVWWILPKFHPIKPQAFLDMQRKELFALRIVFLWPDNCFSLILIARVAQGGTLDMKRSCKDQIEPNLRKNQREGRAADSVFSEAVRWQVGSRAALVLSLVAPTCAEEVRGPQGTWSSWCSKASQVTALEICL